MKIRKSQFIDQDENRPYVTVAVATSFFVFAYSFRFGQLAIIAYYALWLPLLAIDPRLITRGLAFPLLWLFALFAMLSVFWSESAGTTLRASVQLLSHVMCAFIAANLADRKSLARGALLGVAAILLYSLAFGTTAYNTIDGSYTFVGAFTSKNQLGLYASLGIIFGLFHYLFIDRRPMARLLVAAMIAFSAAVLIASSSATSMLAAMATIAAMLGMFGLKAFSPFHRKVFFFLSLCVVTSVAVIAINMGAMDIVLGAFGKDSTLTGRTYLWSEGMAAAHDGLAVGIGYQAYWVQGFSEAERLWAEFYITARSGFHFHNTYIEALVELGIVGTFILVFLMVSTLWRGLARLLQHGNISDSVLVSCVMINLFVRSVSEVDVLTPFAVGSFLLFFCATFLRRSAFQNDRYALEQAWAQTPAKSAVAIQTP